MNVDGKPMRSIWVDEDGKTVTIIDQTFLPHKFETTDLNTLEDAVSAIADMKVRGAPCIGATAAYGMAVAIRNDPSDEAIKHAYETLNASRPTAVNLKWALDQCMATIDGLDERDRAAAAFKRAGEICDEDVEICSKIGDYGLEILTNISKEKDGDTINILTHCNAGWIATVDWGTAIAPIYKAFDAGIDVHVWVDETRPRSQGARLTAWELEQHGVPTLSLPIIVVVI